MFQTTNQLVLMLPIIKRRVVLGTVVNGPNKVRTGRKGACKNGTPADGNGKWVPIYQRKVCQTKYTGWWYTYPSEKCEFVSWDDDIPNIWKNAMFQTTNQIWFLGDLLTILSSTNVFFYHYQVYHGYIPNISKPPARIWDSIIFPNMESRHSTEKKRSVLVHWKIRR